MKKILTIALIALTAITSISCGKDKKEPRKRTTINTVVATRKTINMKVGAVDTARVYYLPGNAEISSGSWEESSHRSIISIGSPQSATYTTIRALAVGEAVIKSSIKDEMGNIRSTNILVTVANEPPQKNYISKISLSKHALVLNEGEEADITASFTPTNADDPDIIFDIKDQGILGYSSWEGNTLRVKGLNKGYTVITARSCYSDAWDACLVCVGTPIQQVRLDKTSADLKLGETVTVTASWEPKSLSADGLYWEANPDLVEVVSQTESSMTVRAIAIGSGTAVSVNAYNANIGASFNIRTYVTMPMAVDLGLSVLWGSCNIGAEDDYGSGFYFGWGETKIKDEHTMYNYAHYGYLKERDGKGYTKYCNDSNAGWKDNQSWLLRDDDIARKLGGKWRMPSKSEVNELLNAIKDKNTFEVTVNYDGKYVTVKNKKNYNFIILPVTGYESEGKILNKGTNGYFWTSDANFSNDEYGKCRSAYNLLITVKGGWEDEPLWLKDGVRDYGFPVRPVCDK